MLDVVRRVAAPATAHVCPAVPAGKESRARAKCLERLLWDLRDQGIDQLVFESRERHNDRKDRLTIVRAQQVGATPKLLGYDFRRPHDEPLLWLPDAVAGAVATRAVGGDPTYVDALCPALSVSTVDL
jgi:hypothetical protein